ncbi:complement decay-accelerating factor-like [Stegodyphus dumicola]|uniref:complement decay-accelerating factor-like n=1 Tax=Stegodyphus dumicola TaxID=202533 RepID=UPI0015AABDBA|nr:complement decay-accelerating factor-like [Stegodyphus dumicola]
MDLFRLHVDLFIVLLFFLIRKASTDFFPEDDDDPSYGRCPYMRNRLKNGRVKIRSRGRIAKFLCDPGYELAGKRFATCVRGQWNNAIPVCVSRGCYKQPDISNGRVTEMYRGALLVYDCLPGYVLNGVGSVYCDGRRWSTDPPSCVGHRH